MTTENLEKEVLEEQDQETKRFLELNQKADRTEEEESELKDLKANYGKKAQEKIKGYLSRAKAAEQAAEERERELERIRAELEEERRAKEERSQPIVREEAVSIDGKKYYTDSTLQAMIQNKELSEAEAYRHQQERIKAEIKWDLRQEQEQERKQTEFQRIREEDQNKVLREYPHFSKRHSNFNPEDELYKLANELFAEGYFNQPDGLSKSINRAKQILGRDKPNPDVSNDLSVEGSGMSGPQGRQEKSKEVKLSKEQEDAAIRIWTSRVNPKTGRNYTESEALEKAKRSIEARSSSRRVT